MTATQKATWGALVLTAIFVGRSILTPRAIDAAPIAEEVAPSKTPAGLVARVLALEKTVKEQQDTIDGVKRLVPSVLAYYDTRIPGDPKLAATEQLFHNVLSVEPNGMSAKGDPIFRVNFKKPFQHQRYVALVSGTGDVRGLTANLTTSIDVVCREGQFFLAIFEIPEVPKEAQN